MRRVESVKIGQVASSDQNNKKENFKLSLDTFPHTQHENNKDIDRFSQKQEKDMLTKMVKKKSKKRNMFFRLPGNPKNMRRNKIKKKKQKVMTEDVVETYIGMKWNERAKFLNVEDEATIVCSREGKGEK